MTEKTYHVDKIFCQHQKMFPVKNSFKVTLQYLFIVFILFNIDFNRKLNFKTKGILSKSTRPKSTSVQNPSDQKPPESKSTRSKSSRVKNHPIKINLSQKPPDQNQPESKQTPCFIYFSFNQISFKWIPHLKLPISNKSHL